MPDNRLLTIAPCIALIECGENFVPCFWREYKLSRWKFITKIDGATGLMHTARAFNTLAHTRHDWDNAVFICECNEFAHNHLKYCGHSCKFFTQSLVLIMHHCADFFLAHTFTRIHAESRLSYNNRTIRQYDAFVSA